MGLPSISEIDAGLALPGTRIYDRYGALLYEILPPEQGRNRVIPLDDMPDVCIHAVIAVEDGNYWSHPGIDPVGHQFVLPGLISMAVKLLPGGSTITRANSPLAFTG